MKSLFISIGLINILLGSLQVISAKNTKYFSVSQETCKQGKGRWVSMRMGCSSEPYIADINSICQLENSDSRLPLLSEVTADAIACGGQVTTKKNISIAKQNFANKRYQSCMKKLGFNMATDTWALDNKVWKSFSPSWGLKGKGDKGYPHSFICKKKK